MIGRLALQVACVALAGALGALARWGMGRWVHAAWGSAWPYATLVVNVLGCLAFGLAMEWTRHSQQQEILRLILLTGFCGAFTTFSTFAFDVAQLQAERGISWAMLNVGLHLCMGGIALVTGLAAGRGLWPAG